MVLFFAIVLFAIIAYLAPIGARELDWKVTPIFGWQLASILQTYLAYWQFVKKNWPRLPRQKKNVLNTVVVLSISVALSVFLYLIREAIDPAGLDWYWKALLFVATDAMTAVPLVVFFLSNVYLWFHFRYGGRRRLPTDKEGEDSIRKIILLADLPGLVPYALVVGFGLFYAGPDLNINDFVAGAGALLLMSSNILSIVLSKYIKNL